MLEMFMNEALEVRDMNYLRISGKKLKKDCENSLFLTFHRAHIARIMVDFFLYSYGY